MKINFKNLILIFCLSIGFVFASNAQCNLSVTTTPVIDCDNLGTATLVIPQGCPTNGWNINWYGPNGFSEGNVQTITNLFPGDYLVIAQNGNISHYQDFVIDFNYQPGDFPVVPNTGSEGDEAINDMVVDQNTGDIYVIGTYTTDIFYTTNFHLHGPIDSRRKIFVAKFDFCGRLQVARYLGYADFTYNGRPREDYLLHIDLIEDGFGNKRVVIFGNFVERISFLINGLSPYLSNNREDVFLAVLNPNTLWVFNNNMANARHFKTGENGGIYTEARGLTTGANAIMITGSFNGKRLFVNNNPLLNKHTPTSIQSDLYIGRFDFINGTLTNNWLTNYYENNYLFSENDFGMATAYLQDFQGAYVYFAYSIPINGVPRTCIGRVNAVNGTAFGSQVFHVNNNDFHRIKDMKASGGDLFLCGQYNISTSTNQKRASVYRIIEPNGKGHNNFLNQRVVKLSAGAYMPSFNNIANKLIISKRGGVFTIGTFTQNQFNFGGHTLQPVGGASHFVAKLNFNTLADVWTRGTILGTTGSSRGYAFEIFNFGDLDVFYIGGGFQETVNLETSLTNFNMTMTANYATDAFIARFIDGGNTIDYRREDFKLDNEQQTANLIYPNPANEIVNIFAGFDMPTANISINDLLGRTVYNTNAIINHDGYIVLNINHLPANTYFVNVNNSFINENYKVVVVK